LKDIVTLHAEEIRAMGIDPEMIGVHSIRKGAATYVCSGSTGGPSIAAVCNRAGWTMGKVKDTYMQYEAAQDQYVGRVVAGLNVNSELFAVSPPYIKADAMREVHIIEDLATVFPFVIPTEANLLMKFCLASLLYSKTFLLTTSGTGSPIRNNSAFIRRYNNQSSLHTNEDNVVIRYPWEDCTVHLTGLPPHVLLFINHKKLMNEVQKVHLLQMSKMEEVSNNAIQSIRRDLDERNIGGGQVSVNRFEEMLSPINQRIQELAQNMTMASSQQQNQLTSAVTDAQSPIPTQYLRYQWGIDNKWRRLPEGYNFNKNLTPLAVWHLWHHGDSVAPPLKLVDSLDICDSAPDRKGKLRPIRESAIRTFWSLKYLCTTLDTAAGIRRGSSPSIAALTEAYNTDDVKACIPSANTLRNRERRANELNWQYAVLVMREEKRRRLTNEN